MITSPRISTLGTWLSEHGHKVVIGVGAAALTVSLVTLGSTLTQPGAQETSAQVQTKVTSLESDLELARTSLVTEHEGLLDQLSGTDVERLSRDRQLARSLALTISATSSSPHGLRVQQKTLATQHPFLAATQSQALTEFLPSWLQATAGTSYTLVSVQPSVLSVKGLTYDYFTLARLDPIDPAAGSPQFLAMTYTTEEDGQISAFTISRVSNRSRDAYLALAQERGEPTATTTPSPAG